jgi:hypothetical protein
LDLPEAQPRDQRGMAGRRFILEVLQEAAASTDRSQQSTATVVILAVDLEVLGEFVDLVGEQGDLNFATAGIGIVGAETFNDLGLFAVVTGHVNSSESRTTFARYGRRFGGFRGAPETTQEREGRQLSRIARHVNGETPG